jgi:signal peptidase I
VAFGVAAVVVHFAKRRPWSAFVVAGVAVAAGAVAGLGTWAVLIVSLVLGSLALSAARRRILPREDPVRPLGGLSGIAWGFVGVLVFREFAALPIHVPTGSMQPTIFGDRPHAMGDHIVVDRLAYRLRGPRRFEICVFDFPLHRPTTFVKRAIGLPGETVEIKDGDIWIDGRIAEKPARVQESLWREVFPKPSPMAQAKKVADAWASSSGWVVEGDGVRGTASGPKESVLRFTRRLEQGDLRVRFDLDFEGECDGIVRITSRGQVVELTWPSPGTSGGGPMLEVAGAPPVPVDASWGPADELAVADGRAVVRRRGRVLAEAPVALEGTRRHAIELCVGGASRGAWARFRNLRVDQDQRWIPGADGTTSWTVPKDAYLVLGDNAENSEDSRHWTVTEFRVKGRAEPLLAAADYPSETGAPIRNVSRDGDAWVFHDVNGLPRRVPATDVESRRDGIPVPFVPRTHFLGRAAFVFWPWAPAEGGFRPRILP